MVEEKLIYDGYVKIYDVKKEKDGKVIEYTKVHLRGSSAGIVINEEGKMALVTQYRPIIGMETLEVPAGTLDKGIPPKEIIIEELEEECGIAKEDIISITDKQREYFQNYYFEDLTLQEASDELNVSKQIISKTILQVTNKLKKYESTLHLNKIYNVLTVIRETTTDENIKKELDKLL